MVNVIFLSFVYLQFNAFGGFHKVCKVNVLWSTTEFVYAHDGHHVIKGNVWICHMKTPKIWTLKRENEVTATAPFLSCQIHKRTICRVLAIVYHITEAFTTVFKLFFILFSMNVIKWMKNKTYCIRNDSLIILAHKSNDFWIRRAFLLYLESWFWFYKHVRAKASVV